MSHPHSRSDQATVCACSSEWRLAHPKGVQRLEMWRCLIRVMDQHDHSLARGRAPLDRNSHTQGAPALLHRHTQQEGPKERITSPCSETTHTPDEMCSCATNQMRISPCSLSWLEGHPQPHSTLFPGCAVTRANAVSGQATPSEVQKAMQIIFKTLIE